MYQEKIFNLPQLSGISEDQVKVHLGLYAGYVKHVNLILDTLQSFSQDQNANPYVTAEVRRRFAFEFDGMRMHEYYFEQFEGGAVAQNPASALAAVATKKYGSYENLIAHIKQVAGTRGIGWVVTYYDGVADTLCTVFVADHELGQLSSLPIVLALDLWEHAYMVDYKPADKPKYIDAFFANLNWSVVENRLQK